MKIGSVDFIKLVDKHIELTNKISYMLYTNKDVESIYIHQIEKIEALLSIKKRSIYYWLANSNSNTNQQQVDVKNYVIDLNADKKCERYVNRIKTCNEKYICKIKGNTIKFNNAKYYQAYECSCVIRDEIDKNYNKINDKISYQKYLMIKNKNRMFKKIRGSSYINSYLGAIGKGKAQIKYELSKFLNSTEDQYSKYLQHYATRYLPRDRVIQKSDLNYIYHNADENKYFTKNNLNTSIGEILGLFTTCDLNLSNMTYIEIVKNTKRLIRPFCAKIEIPNQIRAVIFQAGGYQDFVNALHEIGHLLNNICISEEQSTINKRFVNTIIDEAYGILFESLVANECWILHNLNVDVDTAKNIAKFVRFSDLQSKRKMCGLMLYELEIYSEDGYLLDYKDCKNKYKRIMKDAYKIDVDASECFQSIDDRCYCYSYVKGAEVAKYLENRLVKEYGLAWFKSRRAAEFLISLWKDINSHLDLNFIQNILKD